MIVPATKLHEGIEIEELRKIFSVILFSFMLSTVSFVILKHSVHEDLR